MLTPVVDITATSTASVGPPRQTRKPYRIVMLTQMKWNGTVSQVGTICMAARLATEKRPQPTSSQWTRRPVGEPASGGVEAIALTPDGDDRVRSQLLPQAGHVDVDHVGAGVELVAPDGGQEVLLRDRPARVLDQLPQEQELALRQGHRLG